MTTDTPRAFGAAVTDPDDAVGDPPAAEPAPKPRRDKARVEEPDAEQTVYDGLLADLQKEVRREPVIYEVPDRPGLSVQYDTNITAMMLRGWQKKAFVRRTQKTDEVALACEILGAQCRAIMRGGVIVRDDDGDPMTFATDEILDSLHASSRNDAVRKFYANELVAMTQSSALIIAAGFGEEPQEIEDEEADLSEGPTRQR